MCNAVCGQMLLRLIHCPPAVSWGAVGGQKPVLGGGLGQEFISPLIGPFDCFIWFNLENITCFFVV